MKNLSVKKLPRKLLGKTALCAIISILIYGETYAGQSAVITLGFPIGARPTAMGEAFTGLANDANALFYNPAGLGQSPLTISWKTHMPDTAFTAVAARSSTAFGARNYVWGGGVYGVARFNGRSWERGETYLPEEGETLQSVALQYFNTDDGATISAAVDEIIRANRRVTSDGALTDVTELLIPFTIAVRDTVTALALDPAERLWVGTVNGLWRYHNTRWQHFTTANGLPSNRITALSASAAGRLAVGTETGLAIWDHGEWLSMNDENGLPDSYISAVAHVGTDKLYVGTPQGLAMVSGENLRANNRTNNNADNNDNDGDDRVNVNNINADIVVYDTSSGLLATGVTALFGDSKGRLWIGGENGVTIHSAGRSWRRYRFPGSLVHAFGEQSNGTIWIGTNRGVVTHREGSGDTPDWRTYHSKNALRNDEVRSVAAVGNDMWIATDAAIHQYANAQRQLLLFYEPIMPALKMNDMWHGFPAVVIPTEDWGTVGFSLNFSNMGEHEKWTEHEDYLGTARSWEAVFGVSYGLPVREDLSLGVTAKYVLSVLDSEDDGTGQTFAIDAGILKRNFLTRNLDVGFMLQNMGPNIYYRTPEEADPIPFTLRLGFAYRPIQTPFHELTLVLDAYREVVRSYDDKTPDPFWVALWTGMLNNSETTWDEELSLVNLSLGLEYTYADFMSLRGGFLFDYFWERYELTLGLGVKYENVSFDFSYIYSPADFMEGFVRNFDDNKHGSSGIRDGQWRISFLIGL